MGKRQRHRDAHHSAGRRGGASWSNLARLGFEFLEQRQLLAGDGLQPDRFETNDSLATASDLGFGSAVSLRGLTLHEVVDGPADTDFYRIAAAESGQLTVNASWDLSAAGLQIQVFDGRGHVVASGVQVESAARVAIPTAAGESYGIHVSSTRAAAQSYSLDITQRAASVPQGVLLEPLFDTGRLSNDAITAVTEPRLVIQADLASWRASGLAVLGAAVAEQGNQAGAAIFVQVRNIETGEATTGFANPRGESGELFEFTTPPLSTGTFMVSAAVQVFDPRQLTENAIAVADPATGRTPFSAGLAMHVDADAPTVTSPQMLNSSDSGRDIFDRVTHLSQPAFFGVADPHSGVRVLANGIQVGETMAANDGRWEITVEPLVDGIYAFTTVAEDLAGNLGENPQVVFVEIDTLAPNTPHLDLVPASDSGLSQRDNLTNDASLTFTMTTTDPNAGDHLRRFHLRYRLYARPTGGVETLVYDSAEDGTIPSERMQAGFTDLNLLTATLEDLPPGDYSFKLEVEDRAGNLSHDTLLNVTIDTSLATFANEVAIDLLDANDSGMSDRDNVTNKDQLVFASVAEVGADVIIFERGKVIGVGQVGSDASDFAEGDGLGAWTVAVEPLHDGLYSVIAHVEDAAGNFQRSEPLVVEVDTTPPNTPLLDLLNDTGHSDHDEITGEASLRMNLTSEDPRPSGGRLNEFNYKYRIFVRPEGGRETLIYNSVVDSGIDPELLVEGFTSLEQLQTVIGPFEDGVHNFKLEVEDRAGNISHDFLLNVHLDTTLLGVPNIDLVASSDTGVRDDDNVTGIRSPTFRGTAEVGATVRLTADGVMLAVTEVQSDASDGVPGDGLGVWEATPATLDEGTYEMVALVEDWAGNVAASDALTVEIDSTVPNTPVLDLLEADDSGRHNDDNITNVEMLRFSATTEDPHPDLHAILFPGGENLRYRLYVRPESGEESLLWDSASDESLPMLVDGLTASTRLETPGFVLPEGLHHLKLEVEDRAGNISHDYLTEVLIDRTPAEGTVQLAVGGDTGIWGIDSTLGDGITSMATPTLQGTAEANNIVTVFLNEEPIASTVAKPFDGDDAYPLATWELTLPQSLSDAEHQFTVRFEDPAGNRSDASASTTGIELVVDSVGPRIDNVTRNDDNFTSLFTPKPAGGPDPLLSSIVVHFSDGPSRSEARTYDAVLTQLALEEGNYRLVGDANGNIPITQVEVLASNPGPGRATASIALTFAGPLADDRYTLTVFDRIADAAGNPLDGESGGAAPFDGNDGLTATPPIFPTGDGNHGADFVGRFTVDSRPEIGVWSGGSVYVDTNGNFIFDQDNRDYINRDLSYTVGFASDDVFAGNFAGFEGVADGYDKLAAYGYLGDWQQGSFRWLVDIDNDGDVDLNIADPAKVNGVPVAGDFDGNVLNGDEVALFTGHSWHFDTDHDFQVDLHQSSPLRGYPVVGDFDGDGWDDLATWSDDQFMVDLAGGSANGWDGEVDAIFRFGFIGVRERPVAADMDQDGFHDLGLWVPDRGGQIPRAASEWYWLLSTGSSILDRLEHVTDPVRGNVQEIDFRPQPLGPDLFAQFGDDFGIPVVGNFDPPTVPEVGGAAKFTNPRQPLDVTGDGFISARDALVTINHLNQHGSVAVKQLDDTPWFLDSTGDGHVSPADVLIVVNYLNGLTDATDATDATTEVVGVVDVADSVASDVAIAWAIHEQQDATSSDEDEGQAGGEVDCRC